MSQSRNAHVASTRFLTFFGVLLSLRCFELYLSADIRLDALDSSGILYTFRLAVWIIFTEFLIQQTVSQTGSRIPSRGERKREEALTLIGEFFEKAPLGSMWSYRMMDTTMTLRQNPTISGRSVRFLLTVWKQAPHKVAKQSLTLRCKRLFLTYSVVVSITHFSIGVGYAMNSEIRLARSSSTMALRRSDTFSSAMELRPYRPR